MNSLLSVSSFLAASAISALFSAVWEGTVLALGVFLCLRMFPRLSAAARSAVWIHVFLLLVLLHLAPASGAHWGQQVTARIFNDFHVAPVHVRLVHLKPMWSLGLAGLWLMLSLFRGAQLMVSAVRLRGLARRAVAVDGSEGMRELLEVRMAGGLMRRSATLATSTEVVRPSVLGFFRPCILIPPAQNGSLPATTA
jgi:hypothetical protein